MLPSEVLTLVFLFSAATASPQIQQPTVANITRSIDPIILKTSTPTGDPLLVHEETTATGWEKTETSPNKVHTETHQTTWEDSLTGSPTAPITYTSAEAIGTMIRVSITKLEPETEPTPPGDGDYESSKGGGGGGGSPVPSSTGDLFENIISKITETRGQPQPTDQPASLTKDALLSNAQPTAPSGGSASNGDYTGQPPLTENSLAFPVVQIQPTPGPGLLITVGPDILTLTPGLSTTIGSGFSETLVEMTTDSQGQTVVIVSSSGVATTATLYEATATAPRSATITPEETSGEIRELSSSIPTSTQSTGGGVQQTGNMRIGLLAVLAGFGVVL